MKRVSTYNSKNVKIQKAKLKSQRAKILQLAESKR
jgi:hypothetical protein